MSANFKLSHYPAVARACALSSGDPRVTGILQSA
jgi:hypothetical protein